jgi:hypothetical protein
MSSLTPSTERRSDQRRSAEMTCKITSGESGLPLVGKVFNVSRGGMLIEASACLLVGNGISIEVYSEDPRYTFQAIGQVVSAVEDGPCCRYGVQVHRMSGGMGGAFDEFLSHLNDYPCLADRRQDGPSAFFPIRRRSNDSFTARYLENPYDRFCHTLRDAPRHLDVRTIILSPALDFLGKRVRKVLNAPRLITTDELDDEVTGGAILVVNIDCRRRHESYTFLDFEEMVRQRKRARPEPLHSLGALSRCLSAGQTAAIASVAPLTDRKLVQKYLTVAKFTDIKFISDHVVLAKKRPLMEKSVFDGQFLLEEVQTPQEIDEIHAFSKRLYGKTNNYNEEVDSLFSSQSDYYRVKNLTNGQLITCGRVSWHLPGFPLPMMLAVRAQSEQHIYLTDPDRYSYGEVFAPYMLSVTTGKVYGELIRAVYDYCARGYMDYILTTYQASQSREYRFLSRCVGFRDTGAVLRYGDFGGDWSVVFASKNMFDANWQVAFTAPGSIPILYRNFQR